MNDHNFFQIESGGDRNYGYLVACEQSKQGVLIDPSPDPLPCDRKLIQLNITLKYIVNTHSHFDHSSGNAFFKDKYNAAIICHKNCASGDILVANNQSIELGNLTMLFIHTPGHTADSMSVFINGEIFTGDTLFVGKVGGTGSQEAALTEFASLKKLMALDPKTRVWPGHNYGTAPSSTIKNEKASNPFIRRLDDFNNFYWLKQNWADYKLQHGIR